MNKHHFPVLIWAILTSQMAYAITPQSINGGSGLGLMRTAEILDEDESSYSFSGQVEEYNNLLTPGTSDLHMEALFSYATSLGKHTELGLTAPYSIYKPQSSSMTYAGTRGVRGFIKHRFTGPVRNEGLGVAMSLYSELSPGSASADLTSGSAVYGSELHISNWNQNTGFHLNIGYANDYVWQEAAVPMFVTDNIFSLSAGVEVGVSDALTFALQGMASQVLATSDENLIISTVFSYAMSKTTNMQIGLAKGFLADRSNPAQNFYFALNYSPSSTHRGRYHVDGSNEQLYQQNTDILAKLDSIESQLQKMQSQIDTNSSAGNARNAQQGGQADVQVVHTAVDDTTQPVAGVSTTFNVEIINTTTDHKAEARIRKVLIDAGYHVASVKTVVDNKLQHSIIHYYSGLSEEAKKIGHLFKGDQIIVKRELPEGVDFRFYIGSDLGK